MVPLTASFFLFCFLTLQGLGEGFVLRTQVDLPRPKVADLDRTSELRPKLVKALYEVTFLVDDSARRLDEDYPARAASSLIHTNILTNPKPTVIKVETVTDSLVRKDDDDVPVIKGYDPDERKHLAAAVEDLKKQTDLQVKVEDSGPDRRGWTSQWRPLPRSGHSVPLHRPRDGYLSPPCCPSDHPPQWRL